MENNKIQQSQDSDVLITNELNKNDNMPWDIIENYTPNQQLINENNRLYKFI